MVENRLAAEVVADNVSMTFAGGHLAVADASFAIGGGEFVAIVGPSGCGKSTLLRMIAGLIAPSGGVLRVGKGVAAGVTRGAGRIGFVFQDPRLLPWRTASQNVALPLELDRSPKTTRISRVAGALSLVGLAEADVTKTPRIQERSRSIEARRSFSPRTERPQSIRMASSSDSMKTQLPRLPLARTDVRTPSILPERKFSAMGRCG